MFGTDIIRTLKYGATEWIHRSRTTSNETINLFPGSNMQLNVYPALIDAAICAAVTTELLETQAAYWRQYHSQAGNESRAKLLMHPAGFVPSVDYKGELPEFEPPGYPGYGHGHNKMIPIALRFFPTVEGDLLPHINQSFAPPLTESGTGFYWNCGVNAVLFRDGSEIIPPHSDESQGDQHIVTAVIDCQHHASRLKKNTLVAKSIRS
jgi:hypothetical protein